LKTFLRSHFYNFGSSGRIHLNLSSI